MLKNPSAYGLHACIAMLKNSKREIKHVVLREGDDRRYAEVLTLAQNRGIQVKRQTQESIDQDYPGLVHQGVLLWAKALPEFDEGDLKSLLAALEHPAFILILDGVTDPHNLGACLRSADASGVDMVIIPKDKSASMTPVVAKVSSGASEMVPVVRVVNLARSIQALQALGVWVYGACGETKQSLFDLDAKGPIALVLGAEGDGLRRLTREKCDGLYAIPMLGSVESLNVSVAAGISMYEVRRQRLS